MAYWWVYYAIVAVVSYAAASWMAPDAPKQDGGGTNLTKPDTDAMEAVIYGEMGRVAGTIQHLATNDGDMDDVKNDLLHMIITWGESVSEIIEIYIDDIASTSTAWNDTSTPGNKWLWCYNFTNGLKLTSAKLLEKTGFVIARHKFTDKAVSYVRAEWDNGKRFNGKPNCLAHVKGRAVWDPRTNTWGWSDNPALCLLDYLTNVRYGKGMLLGDIDINSFEIAADICETQVETEIGSGKYQNLFTCNIRIDTTNTVKGNVDTLLKGCRGLLPEINGITTLIIEQDDAVTPEKITEDLITGNIKIKESGTNDRYNRVIVSFIDKEQNWKNQEAIWPDTAQHNIFKAQDNGKLLEKKITLETSTDHNEARQMARILCLLSREALSGTIECAPECIKYTVGDIVPISHPSAMWVDKPFRITSVDYHKEGKVTLHVREHQPYIYDWDGAIRSIPDVTYNDPRDVQSPTSLALLPLADSKLELSWQSNRTEFIVHVYNNDDVIVIKGEPNEKKFIIENLAQGSYSAEVAAISGVGYLSDWSVIQFNILLPTVPNITIDSISDDSVSLSATVGGLPSLDTTFLWQYLGTANSSMEGKVVKGDIFTYTGLLPETNYKFRCRTVNIAGESDWVEISATTLESTAVSNISMEQLDENLANFITDSDRNFTLLNDRVTDEEIRSMENLGSDIEAEIELQTNTVRLGSSESNISQLNIQSERYTSQLNQITHSQYGILAQANDYTYTGVGYWVGDTWREGAISERIRNVRVGTGNGYARVTEIAKAFEDVNGNLVARGGMLTDVNNRVGGFMTYNDGGTTQFDIIGSSFRVGDYVDGNPAKPFEAYLYADSSGLNVEGHINAKSLRVPTANGLIQVTNNVGADGIALSMGGNGSTQYGGVTLWNKGKIQVYSNGETAIRIEKNSRGGASDFRAMYIAEGAGILDCENAIVAGSLSTNAGSIFSTSGDFTAYLGDFIARAGYFRSPNTAIVNFTGGHPYLLSKRTNANPLGMLVTEGDIESKTNLSSVLGYASCSTSPRDTSCVGTVSDIERLATSDESHSLYGLTQSREVEVKNKFNIAIVNAVGDGLMWVCSESGDIAKGNWLCSSSTVGHAMRQTDEETGMYEKYFTDYTVAKARESVTWADEPSDKKLIAVYYKGG